MRAGVNAPRRARVLVVEDSGNFKRHYVNTLARGGFEVAEASKSEVLQRVLEEHSDAVILDISMPAINGLELVRNIRERSPDLPVIMILEAADNQIAIRATELGAVQPLVKPQDPDLLEAANLVIQRRRDVTRLRLRRHLAEPLESYTATDAKNEFGRVLDTVVQGRPVYITKHDARRAVLLSIEEYNALISPNEQELDSLTDEFDALLARMQTPEARQRMSAAFNASPKQLGAAAVAAARKRG